MKLVHLLILFSIFLFGGNNAYAQISPGELCKAHSSLEGLSNCTKCHDVGNKVTREKCLQCHTEINQLISRRKGFHASSEVAEKECYVCHNDHHGRNFQIVKFDKMTFNHSKTGFELKGAHTREDCKACNCKSCHKPSFIKDADLKKRTTTYLGLDKACLSCHDDFHQGKMSPDCSTCHSFDSFKNATGFDHNTTKFPLTGKHLNVDCLKCHKTQIVNGKPVQQFKGLLSNNCTSCHKDAHDNKFGPNCKQCHSEESFHIIKSTSNFDHIKTGFDLVGKHKSVACKSCHIKSLTAPIRHERCSDCHSDYHKKEFTKDGISPDCYQCHSNDGFTASLYTIEKHNLSAFPLEGAHLATPCTACHKKETDWKFRKIGDKCVDCHKNEHKGFIQEKYYPGEKCTECHNVNRWKGPEFDHSVTKFKLEGIHAQQTCATCHYPKNNAGLAIQKFKDLSTDCSACHKDTHAGQFEINRKTDCTRCHGYEDWKKSKFDHNSSRFKLEGAHLKVACEKCHTEEANGNGKFIQYKNNKILCSNCHQ